MQNILDFTKIFVELQKKKKKRIQVLKNVLWGNQNYILSIWTGLWYKHIGYDLGDGQIGRVLSVHRVQALELYRRVRGGGSGPCGLSSREVETCGLPYLVSYRAVTDLVSKKSQVNGSWGMMLEVVLSPCVHEHTHARAHTHVCMYTHTHITTIQQTVFHFSKWGRGRLIKKSQEQKRLSLRINDRGESIPNKAFISSLPRLKKHFRRGGGKNVKAKC